MDQLPVEHAPAGTIMKTHGLTVALLLCNTVCMVGLNFRHG